MMVTQPPTGQRADLVAPEIRGLVLVEWVDSTSNGAWQHRREAVRKAGCSRCCTVGMVLSASADSLTLLQSVSLGTDEVDATFSIPRAAITRIRRLEVRHGH